VHLAEKALRIGRDDLARDFRHIGAEEPVRQLGGVTLTHPEMCTLMYTNTYVYIYINIIEGSLEVKLPTIWTGGKAEVGRVREEKSRRSEKRKSQKKADAGARTGRKVAKQCVFQ